MTKICYRKWLNRKVFAHFHHYLTNNEISIRVNDGWYVELAHQCGDDPKQALLISK